MNKEILTTLKMIAEDIKQNGDQLSSGIYLKRQNNMNCYYLGGDGVNSLLFTRPFGDDFASALMSFRFTDNEILEVLDSDEINQSIGEMYDSFFI